MAFTFSVKDTYRQAVEAASGGKQTVLYDNKGIPSIMNIIPRQTYQSLGVGSSTKTHDAWLVNDVEKPEIFIGTYMASVHEDRAQSLPGQVPKVYVTHDQAVTFCRNKGRGWHCITRAEWAAIALWCKANGYFPRGNNNYGSDIGAAHERCRPATKGSDQRINLGLTGSGPSSWTHDGTPHGIYGLNGDGWEWNIGVRCVNGEIQVLPHNDAALDTADLTPSSAAWKAILQDGSLVAPGTSGTLKYNGGTPSVVTNVTNTSSGNCQFKSIAVGSGIAIPEILKALALFPTDNSEHGGDYFYINPTDERCFLSGGRWSDGARAGVFDLHGSNPRSGSYGDIGFRPAYVSL